MHTQLLLVGLCVGKSQASRWAAFIVTSFILQRRRHSSTVVHRRKNGHGHQSTALGITITSSISSSAVIVRMMNV